MENKLHCGAAKADITPPEDILPLAHLARYEIAGVPAGFGGIIDRLYVRALALSCDGNQALIIAFDLGGTPDPAANIEKISRQTGIPVENIIFTATHAHATPFMKRFIKPENEFEVKMNRIIDNIEIAMMNAISQALANMKPAVVGFGRGVSDININRNKDLVVCGQQGTYLAFNGQAECEKTLDVLKFDDLAGHPIAFIINYPVHAVVMHMNSCFGKYMGISGDIPGRASSMIENIFDNAVALWTSGAAGNQNPIMMNAMFYPDPITGKSIYKTSGETNSLELLSARHTFDVLDVINKIDKFSDHPSIAGAIATACAQGKEYSVRMQVLRVGETALVGIGGELFNSIGKQLKEKSPLRQTVIVTHNVSVTNAGYIVDDDGLARKVHGSDFSRQQPGFTIPAMLDTLETLFDQVM